MADTSKCGPGSRLTAQRRRGRILLEFAIVKTVSLAMGVAIASAFDPAASILGERMLIAVAVETIDNDKASSGAKQDGVNLGIQTTIPDTIPTTIPTTIPDTPDLADDESVVECAPSPAPMHAAAISDELR